jgi:VanZ family protein
LLAVLYAFFLSYFVESLQVCFQGRSSQLFDVLVNGFSAVLGIAAASYAIQRGVNRRILRGFVHLLDFNPFRLLAAVTAFFLLLGALFPFNLVPHVAYFWRRLHTGRTAVFFAETFLDPQFWVKSLFTVDLYFLFSFLLFLGLVYWHPERRLRAALFTVLTAFCLIVCAEFLQIFFPPSYFEISQVLAALLGSVLGSGCAHLMRPFLGEEARVAAERGRRQTDTLYAVALGAVSLMALLEWLRPFHVVGGGREILRALAGAQWNFSIYANTFFWNLEGFMRRLLLLGAWGVFLFLWVWERAPRFRLTPLWTGLTTGLFALFLEVFQIFIRGHVFSPTEFVWGFLAGTLGGSFGYLIARAKPKRKPSILPRLPEARIGPVFMESFLVTAAFMLLIGVVFWELVSLKSGFLSGDHRVQHYPWMYFLQSELKAGRFPLWTGLIGCGFPIFAEGQIALIYPLNLLFYGLLPLPFPAAYNYSTLFHFLLGALASYLYGRTIGLGRAGSFLAAALFVFGSAQGGYFYNMNSQKVCVWFPFVLFLFERHFKSRKLLPLLWAGIIFGVQLNAGYLQIAVYAVGFSLFYFLVRSVQTASDWQEYILGLPALVFRLILLAALAVGVALPQLCASFEVLRYSSRTALPESFAFVGSLPPQGILTLLFPFLDAYLGQEIYTGIFGIFLVILALAAWRSLPGPLRALGWVGALALLFALGQFSPLYVAFVKLTHFYGFRVPAKAVFFLAAPLCFFAGFGLKRLIEEPCPIPRPAVFVFSALMVLTVAAGIAGGGAIETATPSLKTWGAWILKHFYVGSPIHPYPYETYLARLQNFLGNFKNAVSFENPWMRGWVLIAALNLALAPLFLIRKRVPRVIALAAALLILAGDLYAYQYVNNIRGGWEGFESYFQTTEKFVRVLKKDGSPWRLYEYQTSLEQNERFPILYNLNMRYGLSDVGAYAPFALLSHRNYFEGLGASNDSLTVSMADPKRFSRRRYRLDLSNVKYVLSETEPPGGNWRRIFSDQGFALYENKRSMPRAYWMPRGAVRETLNFENYMKDHTLEPARKLVLTTDFPRQTGPPPGARKDVSLWKKVAAFEDRGGEIIVRTNFKEPGWLFLSQVRYPGWRVELKRRTVKPVPANGIFQAVAVPKGRYRVVWRYEPYYRNTFWVPFALFAAAGFFSLVAAFRILVK